MTYKDKLQQANKEAKSAVVAPVSYTHLDVYKRQAERSLYRWCMAVVSSCREMLG